MLPPFSFDWYPCFQCAPAGCRRPSARSTIESRPAPHPPGMRGSRRRRGRPWGDHLARIGCAADSRPCAGRRRWAYSGTNSRLSHPSEETGQRVPPAGEGRPGRAGTGAPAGAKSGRRRRKMEARPERRPNVARLRSRHDSEAALEADTCTRQTGLLAARRAPALRPQGLGSRLDRQLRTHIRPRGAPLNPDVFITIVFGGFAAFMAFAALLFVIPKARRDDARASELSGSSRSREAADVRRPRSSGT
jgi:hypothetical protein